MKFIAAILFFVLYAVVIVGGIIGYIANIVQTIHMVMASQYDNMTLVVLKLIGILIAPAGTILGWVGLLN